MKQLSLLMMSGSHSKSKSKNLVDKSTQTVIKVHPYVFDNVDDFACVTSNKKLQSSISIKPDEETSKFINLLRFTPYQDITQNCLRIVDLERKKKLQFAAAVEFQAQSDHANQFSMADDDGVGYICCEVIRKRLNKKRITVYQDDEAQTDLKVHPHVLENLDVAVVVEDKDTQTTDLENSKKATRPIKGSSK